MFNVDLFSPNSTLAESNALSVSKSFATDIDHSFFAETTQFLMGLDEEMLNNNKNFYKSLCEAQEEPILIDESFSDWTAGIKKIIDKILDFLKAILNKFLVGLNMLVKREGYLKSHKKDFNKFSDEDHKFLLKVFNFTFDVACPSETVLTDYSKSLDSITSMLTDRSAGEKDPLAKVTTAYENYINSLDGDYYDQIRAEVMGLKNTTIDASEFSAELFKIFRDDNQTKEEKEITHQDVIAALTFFDSYEKIKGETTKKKTHIEKEYNAIKKSIDNASKKDGKTLSVRLTKDGDMTAMELGEEVAAKYDMYIKAKSNEIQEISSIHALAFSAKLDALKDCFNQDKTILYKALYRILGNVKTGVRD